MVGRNFLEHPEVARFEVLAPSRAELDLKSFDSVKAYLDLHQPDLLIHCAGTVGGIQANMREPVRFLVENMDMGRNVVLACRASGVRKLINLGSSCMFPRDYDQPLREEWVLSGQLEPTNEGYALAKVMTARLCEYISRESPDYRFKTLIPCNLYGRHDKFDPAHSHLLPAIIHKTFLALKNGDNSVEIWGDGLARREFMYAGDLADALVRAIYEFDGLPSMMNVGLGHDYSINEYYRAVALAMGYTGEFRHDLGRPVGMSRKLVCTEKQEKWGWSPKTDLHSGIQKTVDYYLSEQANGL